MPCPAIIGAIVNLATDGGSRATLGLLVLAMVALTGIGMLGIYHGRIQAALFGESILDELRSTLFDAIVALPSLTVESVGTGELVARATGDVDKLSRAARNAGPAVVLSIFEAFGIVVALLIADAPIGLAGIAASVAVAAPGVRWYLVRAPVRYHRERQAEADRSASLLEHYNGRATLWAFGATGLSHDVLAARGDSRVAANLSSAGARNVLRLSLRIGQGVGLAVVLAMGAVRFEDGLVSAGVMTAVILYMLRLMDPVAVLLEQLDALQDAQVAFQRIIGVIERSAAEANDRDWPDDDRPGTGLEVRLDAVVFGYEPGNPVLDGIDLVIPAGQRIMIVGPSGAGKSTLAGLIGGTYRPWHGVVRVGGVDLAGIRAEQRRSRVSTITQETHVFERSIRDNVALGRPGASDDDIAASLRTADAWGWVSALDNGLDTVVSASHQAITPARAQQLNLARLLCLDPAVVVLDESTADIGLGAANRVERRLAEALDGRTVLSIAHRLDLAPAMDRIVMIDGGVVVDDGPHDDLVVADGPYARLWTTWQRVRTGRDDAASSR
ncbi:MAG: ABC transporter ATP-binding protein [Actinomycetota bacterium]